MSMVGVKQRLEEQYDELLNHFETYQYKVHNKSKKYNPKIGYDQLGLDAKTEYSVSSSLLYANYFSLRMLEDIKPDLRERA